MSVSSVFAKLYFTSEVGTINTTGTFNKTQTFNPPVNILALPVLQEIDETDDISVTSAFISEFVDGGVTHTGKFMGIVATKCTKIVWTLFTSDAGNNPARLIFFF